MTPPPIEMGPYLAQYYDAPNTLAGFLRNGGRIGPEWVAGFNRNRWPD